MPLYPLVRLFKHSSDSRRDTRCLGLQPMMYLVLFNAALIWYGEFQVQLTWTSGSEGAHGKGSLHFAGYAVDLSTHNLDDEQAARATAILSDSLGRDFDVVTERTHIHVEFQPKNGVNQ